MRLKKLWPLIENLALLFVACLATYSYAQVGGEFQQRPPSNRPKLTGSSVSGAWTWQSPSTTGNTLRAVAFVDSLKGWIAGDNGTILYTEDGGESWSQQQTGIFENLYGLAFFDALHGCAVGENGIILLTSDGGITWEFSASTTNHDLRSVVFADAQNGWAVGSKGTILHTGDGGTTWMVQTSNTTKTLYDVSFVSASRGWAVGRKGVILQTTDGGISWAAKTEGIFDYYSVTFIDENNGWACGTLGKIVHTSDGGAHWQEQTIGGGDLWDVAFVDENNGWAVGHYGLVLHTANGGTDWETQREANQSTVYGVHFLNQNIGWAVGAYGRVLYTNKGGSEWESQKKGPNFSLFGVHFLDDSVGWAIGYQARMVKTRDGGKTWQEHSSGISSSYAWDIFFINHDVGWAGANNGLVLRTVDAGSTWTAANTGASGAVISISFVDEQHGWGIVSGSRFIRTSDGGESWEVTQLPLYYRFNAINFVNQNQGWAAGANGTILHSNDGGNNWSVQTAGTVTTLELNSIYFVDESHGWAVGGDNRNAVVLVTNNGGASWSEQAIPTTRKLTKVQFVDGATGWAVGNSGTILSTSDGGQTWALQPGVTYDNLYALSFPDRSNGWAVGRSGTILKFTAIDEPLPVISVAPSTLDFGQIVIGRADTLEFTVYSRGNTDLLITDIVSNHSAFAPLQTNLKIAPAQTQNVKVRFAPATAGLVQGTLEIHSNDPQKPVLSVHMTGEGREFAVIFVDANATGAKTGKNWHDAYATLQQAIDEAATLEDVEIWVARGTYFENLRMKRGAKLFGGFAGTETSREQRNYVLNKTIIDGGAQDVVIDASDMTRGEIIDGFTITHGKGNIINGGGINLDLSSATIKHNIIAQNDPYGIWHRGFQRAWIEGNLIINNKERGYDGNNSQAIFVNNTVVNNPVGLHAIGFYVPSPKIVNCIFWNNGEDITGSAKATYSDIQEGASGFGNFSQDPQFIDPENGDYHLQLTSPCLDSGDPTKLDPDGTRSDVGAYPVFQGGGRFGAPRNLQAKLVQARNAPAVELSWESPPPMLEVSVNNLYFDTYDLGWAFFLKNSGLGRLNWTAASDVNWLQLIPKDGVALLGTGQLVAFADRGNLPVGEYHGNIIITSNGGDKTIAVTLKVGPTPIPGKWRGSGISFHVSESMQRVSSLVFTKSSGNNTFKFEFNGSVPIDSTQSFTITSGDITIAGTFTSRSTASGTYSIPFNPSPSGTWSASPSGNAHAKAEAASKLSGYLDSDIQLIASYNIYRGTAPGSYDSLFASVSGNIFTYLDSAVVVDTTYFYTVKAEDQQGQLSLPTNEVAVQIVPTGIANQSEPPTVFELFQNYPNPFNPETTICYQLPKATEVKLEIYNLLGQCVATLVEQNQPAGNYSIKWDGTDQFGHSLASGVYLYRLQAGDFVQVRKLMLLQ